MKISFVLPCYNVGRYIAQCLDSIENQDMPEDEYEVICVDDCSTDNTSEIIKDYQLIHTNIQYIRHKENLTSGGARNTGIALARGEYIWFVDPDDLIKPQCLNRLYAIATSRHPQILMFNFEAVNVDLEYLKTYDVFLDSTVSYSGQDFAQKYFPNNLAELCIIFRCLFEARFLKEKHLVYPIMRKAQDVSFLWKVLLYTDSISSISDVFYINRGNPHSVANKGLEANVAFSERILFANEIYMMSHKNDVIIQKPILDEMHKALVWCVNSNLPILSKMTIQERNLYYDMVVGHKSIINRLKCYMNRKSKLLYSISEGRILWLQKVRIMSLLFN